MSKGRGVEAWLGLLILGIVTGSWLKFPRWLIKTLAILFGMSVPFLGAASLHAFALRRDRAND